MILLGTLPENQWLEDEKMKFPFAIQPIFRGELLVSASPSTGIGKGMNWNTKMSMWSINSSIPSIS